MRQTPHPRHDMWPFGKIILEWIEQQSSPLKSNPTVRELKKFIQKDIIDAPPGKRMDIDQFIRKLSQLLGQPALSHMMGNIKQRIHTHVRERSTKETADAVVACLTPVAESGDQERVSIYSSQGEESKEQVSGHAAVAVVACLTPVAKSDDKETIYRVPVVVPPVASSVVSPVAYPVGSTSTEKSKGGVSGHPADVSLKILSSSSSSTFFSSPRAREEKDPLLSRKMLEDYRNTIIKEIKQEKKLPAFLKSFSTAYDKGRKHEAAEMLLKAINTPSADRNKALWETIQKHKTVIGNGRLKEIVLKISPEYAALQGKSNKFGL